MTDQGDIEPSASAETLVVLALCISVCVRVFCLVHVLCFPQLCGLRPLSVFFLCVLLGEGGINFEFPCFSLCCHGPDTF